MALYLGANKVKPYLASTEIAEAYVGSTLVYQNISSVELFPPASDWTRKGANASSCTVNDTNLIAKSSTNNTNGRCVSTITIDPTAYSVIVFTVTASSKNGNAGVWVGTTTNSDGSATNASMTAYQSVNGAGTYTVSLSGLTALQYVQVACWGSTGSASCTVTNIIIE